MRKVYYVRSAWRAHVGEADLEDDKIEESDPQNQERKQRKHVAPFGLKMDNEIWKEQSSLFPK